MKILILVLIGSMAQAQTVGTYHKTPSGKYPIYYRSAPGDVWTEENQKDYDDKMDETLNELCVDSVSVQRAQAVIKHEKEVGAQTGYVNTLAIHDAGSVLVNLKPTIERLAKIVKTGTGKEASKWECPQ